MLLIRRARACLSRAATAFKRTFASVKDALVRPQSYAASRRLFKAERLWNSILTTGLFPGQSLRAERNKPGTWRIKLSRRNIFLVLARVPSKPVGRVWPRKGNPTPLCPATLASGHAWRFSPFEPGPGSELLIPACNVITFGRQARKKPGFSKPGLD
jgi:hypothetical protein